MAITNGPNLGLAVNGALDDEHYLQLMAQWRGLDGLIQCRVLDKDLSAPPGSPVNGNCYIVGPTPSGSWATHAGEIARYFDVGAGAPGWEFFTPKEGWRAYAIDESLYYRYNGTAWVAHDIPSSTKQAEWDQAYAERNRWDGGDTGLNAATGRSSLGLGTAAQANLTTSSTDKTANSVLKVGDGGLLVPIVLVGPNLTTRRSTGFYYAQAPANSPPGASSGWVLQQDISDAYNTLMYVDAVTGDYYHRTLSNSVQKPWREFWDTGNTSANVQTMLSAANNAAIRAAISASSLPPYTLGTVPSAAANTNLLIVITDLTGGREPCFSDGTNWLRCSDKTVAN